MITTNNLNEARKQIQELKKKNEKVVVLAHDEKFNRKIFESKDVDMVCELEFHGKDKIKQRDSGLNEILCKLAKENNIEIGINLNKIKSLEKTEKAVVLARIIQNINLCKRVGCKLTVIGDYGKQEIMSFFLTFKGNTNQGITASNFK